jgi:pimeloyl-ACP methyl ester carboxylesterase
MTWPPALNRESRVTKLFSQVSCTKPNIVMIWGGLHPIPYHVGWDTCTILSWIIASYLILAPFWKNCDTRRYHGLTVMLLSCLGTCAALKGHVTNRWTITLPMVPLLIIHLFAWVVTRIYLVDRHMEGIKASRSPAATAKNPEHVTVHIKRNSLWIQVFAFVVALLCSLCIISALSLSILFPAVELPPISDGKYEIGVIDFYIPLASNSFQYESCLFSLNKSNDESGTESACWAPFTSSSDDWFTKRNASQLYLPTRLLYPTVSFRTSEVSLRELILNWIRRVLFFNKLRIPYLRPDTAIGFCRHSMRFGAPKPIKSYDWILHTWRLASLPLRRNAPLVAPSGHDQQDTIALVVYSHGLGGDMDLYSYQAMSLAANGYMVLTMTHTDGTAPFAPQPDFHYGSAIPHNENILKLYADGNVDAYELARKHQNEIRVHEYLYALEQVLDIFSGSNSADKHGEHVQEVRNSLKKKKLVINATYFMGHSFGAATALTAAYRRPDLVDAIIAHEPMLSWASNDLCHSFFSEDKLDGINLAEHGITAPVCSMQSQPPTKNMRLEDSFSIHDLDIILLNSNEWMDKNWGKAKLLSKMYRIGRIGKNRDVSYHGFVNQSHHNEFSDTCMLTPLWLARAVGLTGKRNPIDTATEIASITRNFLEKRRLHLISTN